MHLLAYDKGVAEFEEGELCYVHVEGTPDEDSICFWLPMENKCCLFLYVRGDGTAWGTLKYDPRPGQTDASTFTYCYIRGGVIEVTTGKEPLDDGSWMFPNLQFVDITPMLSQMVRLPIAHVEEVSPLVADT